MQDYRTLLEIRTTERALGERNHRHQRELRNASANRQKEPGGLVLSIELRWRAWPAFGLARR